MAHYINRVGKRMGGQKNLLLLGTEKIERGGGVSRTDHKHADIPALLCNRVQVGQHLYVYTRRGNRFFLFHLFFFFFWKISNPNLSSKRKEMEKNFLNWIFHACSPSSSPPRQFSLKNKFNSSLIPLEWLCRSPPALPRSHSTANKPQVQPTCFSVLSFRHVDIWFFVVVVWKCWKGKQEQQHT